MANHVSIAIEDDEQYDRLQEVRERYGVTWKGLLMQGVLHLESQDVMADGGDDAGEREGGE